MGIRHPKALLRFLSLRRTAQTFHYGHESPDHFVELHRCGKPGAPLVVFMHGGAWFSGRPWMYRLISTALNRRDMDVGIVGYGTYKTLPPIPGTRLPDPALDGTADPAVVLGHVDHQVRSAALEHACVDTRLPHNAGDVVTQNASRQNTSGGRLTALPGVFNA